MGTHLARELEKYYEKGPNNTLFRNGMIQGLVADEMHHWLMKRGLGSLSEGFLSKVLKGERLFSPAQLEAFCFVVQLTWDERRKLELALYEDQREKDDWAANLLLPPWDFDLASDNLEQVVGLRSRGYPYQAIDLASTFGRWLVRKSSSLKFPEPLHRIGAMGLFEVAQALREIVSPAELAKKVEPIADEIGAIADMIRDEEMFGLAKLAKADAAHIAGKYGSSTFLLEQALPVLSHPDYRLAALRLLLLDWPRAGTPRQFERTEAMTRKLLEANSYTRIEQACSTWAGLGHGLGLLGREEQAAAAFERAAFLCDQIERTQPAPRLRIQILRGRIAVGMKSKDPNTRLLQEDVERGYALARQFRLARYQELFRQLHRSIP